MSTCKISGYVKHVHKPGNVVRVVHCQELAPSSPVLMEHTFKSKYLNYLGEAMY